MRRKTALVFKNWTTADRQSQNYLMELCKWLLALFQVYSQENYRIHYENMEYLTFRVAYNEKFRDTVHKYPRIYCHILAFKTS